MRHALCVALLVSWLLASPGHADAPPYPQAPEGAPPSAQVTEGPAPYPQAPEGTPAYPRAPASASPYPPASIPPAPIGGDSQYRLAPGGTLPASWSHADEAWYRQNRAFATTGKVLTVLGISLTIASAFTSEQAPLLVAGVGTQALGQLTWSAAEVRGANELARRGARVRSAAGIVALCGALVLSPLTWIAGPIQSAKIRHAHDEMTYGRSSSGTRGATFASYGLGFRGTF